MLTQVRSRVARGQMIMIESEGITENVKSWRTDVISAVTSALPTEKIMCVSVSVSIYPYFVPRHHD